jgi:hypothetical protein
MAGPFYAEPLARLIANPGVAKLAASEAFGRVRILEGRYATTTSPPAVGEIIQMVPVPAGMRILRILMANEALSSGAAAAGANVGDGGDADRFIAAYDMDAAHGLTALALRLDTTATDPALGAGYKYTVDDTIDLVVTGEDYAASKMIFMEVWGVID